MVPEAKNWLPARESDDEEETSFKSPTEIAIEERSRPYGGFCLIFDTETFSFKDGQRVRFGVYQIRGIIPEERAALYEQGHLSDDDFRMALDTPHAWGVFYNPALTHENELAEIERYVRDVNSREVRDPWTEKPLPKCDLLEVQDFVEDSVLPLGGSVRLRLAHRWA